MLSFDWSNVIVIAAVVVILFVYRQLDKNNRSLEKIRKFAETVRHDLNAFVEERTATVKDFETVLKVHDKTAAEILRRIQAVEGNLLTRTPEIEAMAGDPGSAYGSGGMVTKLTAARICLSAGCSMAITKGGTERKISVKRMSTASTQPPKYPATRPIISGPASPSHPIAIA